MPPHLGQLALLIVSMLLMAVGMIVPWLTGTRAGRLAPEGAAGSAPTGEATRGMAQAGRWLWAGIICGLVVVVWHSLARRDWIPLGDNFETLIWLGLLLAGFVLYMRARRPLSGLDLFVLPGAMGMLIAAAILGSLEPREYVTTTWSLVHRISTYGGTLAFVIAGAVAGMYLMANRRLRRKQLSGPMASLERLEHLMLTSVTLGFALMTLGVVTGLVHILGTEHARHKSIMDQLNQPKIIMGLAVWLLFAIVMHTPINPRLRGRRAAILSIAGCLLTLGTLIVALVTSGGGH